MSESQTPLWYAATRYEPAIPDIPDPIEKANRILQDRKIVESCVAAGICVKCGEPLTYEIYYGDMEGSIDTKHPSCQKCMIRYKAELY